MNKKEERGKIRRKEDACGSVIRTTGRKNEGITEGKIIIKRKHEKQ